MNGLLIGFLLLGSLSSLAASYDCANRGEVQVKTSLFSQKVKSVDGNKIKGFSDYISAKEKYGSSLEAFERYHDTDLVTEAFNEEYRIIGETGYSRGFFELDNVAYVILVDMPSPWCIWDACRTYYKINKCTLKTN